MKKLFFVFAIASLGFVACNDEKKAEETPAATETPAPTPAQDTTTAPAGDTTKAPAADTTQAK